MPEPLPSNLPSHIEDSEEVKDAYSKVLKSEQAMIPTSSTHRRWASNEIDARQSSGISPQGGAYHEGQEIRRR